jgi:hypothetical protein
VQPDELDNAGHAAPPTPYVFTICGFSTTRVIVFEPPTHFTAVNAVVDGMYGVPK